MTKINIGDKVYRRTINDHVLTQWEVVAKRGWLLKEYYLIKRRPITDKDFLVVESHRNLFKVDDKQDGGKL